MFENTETSRRSFMPAATGQDSAPEAQRSQVPEEPTAAAKCPPFVGILCSLSLIDEARSLAETVSVSRQLLSDSFPRTPMVFGWCGTAVEGFSVIGGDGVPLQCDPLTQKAVALFLGAKGVRRPLPLDGTLRRFFGPPCTGSVTSVPFVAGGEILGFVSLLNSELQSDELLVVELVACRVAAKLLLLRKERERAEQSELSARMMQLADSLLRSESKEELCKTILHSAADLTGACQGSIMLLSTDGSHLQVVQATGAGSESVHNLNVQVGTGIAGRVAERAGALLVRDVEGDPRTARHNRPRFKSKSFLCLPFKLNDKVLGVLNLTDKGDLTQFGEADLKLLTIFCAFGALMIERSQARDETSRLERLSCTDPLTGTYNRRFLNARLEEELNRSLRQKLEFTLLFIDLDHFKNYNDRFGHLAGDEALVKTTLIVKSNLRDMDILARFGGEEFCVLLPGTSKRRGQLVAERIRLGVERERFLEVEGPGPGRLTVSLGVATYPEDGTTVTSLLNASDAALYQAKASGRNRITAAKPISPGGRWPAFLPV
jgi:diguanylate cyclase (GGDEF)-like protein